jgi:adenylylsulfate kinase-like enzyme
MLRDEKWKKWLDRETRFIWIHGLYGTGKTVLASFLYRTLEKEINRSMAAHLHIITVTLEITTTKHALS